MTGDLILKVRSNSYNIRVLRCDDIPKNNTDGKAFKLALGNANNFIKCTNSLIYFTSSENLEFINKISYIDRLLEISPDLMVSHKQLSMSDSNKTINLADPVSDEDAATKTMLTLM